MSGKSKLSRDQYEVLLKPHTKELSALARWVAETGQRVVVVFEGRIESLRRFKDDVSEVRQGFECGISIERFQDVKVGDIIEAYTTEEVAPTSL